MLAVTATVAVVWFASSDRVSLGQPPQTGSPQAQGSPVRAVELPSSGVDGAQTWLIDQNKQRIPEIPGVASELPIHIERRLQHAFDLAQRGATYTAADEFQAVLQLCAQELDGRQGGTQCREALCAGWLAIREADDFTYGQDLRDTLDVRRLAAGHTTPGVKGGSQPICANEAIQIYYAYAENQLAKSCSGLPGASIAYYGLGRTYVTPGQGVRNPMGKAALLHRTALDITPQNVLAANELGVLLAQHGRLDGAKTVLEHALRTKQTPQTWRNLAAVQEQLGDLQASGAASQAANKLESISRAAAAPAYAASQQQDTPQVAASDDSSEPTGILARLPSFRLSDHFRGRKSAAD